MEFGVYGIILIVECAIAVVLLIVIIALAATGRKKKLAKRRINLSIRQTAVKMYDPSGMSAPISDNELGEIDRQARENIQK